MIQPQQLELGASDETANKDNQKDSGDTTIILTGDVLFANAFKAAYDAGGIERVVSPWNC
ncbi:MAG: hypothetical protein ACLVCH_12730 [Roseburia inulinivorans]